MPETLPACCTVQVPCLIYIFRYRLQSGDIDDSVHGDILPAAYDHDGKPCQVLIGEQALAQNRASDHLAKGRDDVSKKIHHLKFQADSIVVDPPRSGLTSDGINDILKINPKKLVYVSCDPMTLARDLKLLKSNYEVKEVTLFDMFPWTYHVESVVLCIKK